MADEIKQEVKTEVKETPKLETKTEVKQETAKAITEKTPVETKTETAKETKTETKAETEQKPAEELKTLLDEAGEEKEGEVTEKVIPEKYEFKLPEGVTLDEAALALVAPVFKELGLDNAQAQKLMDLQIAYNKQNEDAHVTQFNQYVENLKTEAKEYFGTKLPDVMRNVARFRDTFMPKSADGKDHPLLDKLNISGLANDKDFIELFDKVGRVIGEGKFVEGKRSAPVMGKAGQTQEQVQEGVALTDVYSATYKK